MHPVIHFLVQGCGLNRTPVHALRFTIDECNSDLGGWLIFTIATINVHGLGWATRIVINPVRACQLISQYRILVPGIAHCAAPLALHHGGCGMGCYGETCQRCKVACYQASFHNKLKHGLPPWERCQSNHKVADYPLAQRKAVLRFFICR